MWGDRSGKRGRPEDLVHILEGLMQTTAEMEGLPGIEDLQFVLTRAQTECALSSAEALLSRNQLAREGALGRHALL